MSPSLLEVEWVAPVEMADEVRHSAEKQLVRREGIRRVVKTAMRSGWSDEETRSDRGEDI